MGNGTLQCLKHYLSATIELFDWMKTVPLFNGEAAVGLPQVLPSSLICVCLHQAPATFGDLAGDSAFHHIDYTTEILFKESRNGKACQQDVSRVVPR